MLSKYFHLKQDAIRMRENGLSITGIEKNLSIPRSTLSGWFKNITLTQNQMIKLKHDQLKALKKARVKASLWHRQQKQNSIKEAEQQAKDFLSSIDIQNKNMQEIALAMLWLGEGFKASKELGIGNSDPLILRFFMYVAMKNFNIKRNAIRCELYLRSDQDPLAMKKYWAKTLHLSSENFRYIHFDKRTEGTKTYPTYKGVCSLRFGNLAVQRKLLYIARKYCQKVLKGS